MHSGPSHSTPWTHGGDEHTGKFAELVVVVELLLCVDERVIDDENVDSVVVV